MRLPGACCRAQCSVSGPSRSCAVTADRSNVERGRVVHSVLARWQSVRSARRVARVCHRALGSCGMMWRPGACCRAPCSVSGPSRSCAVSHGRSVRCRAGACGAVCARPLAVGALGTSRCTRLPPCAWLVRHWLAVMWRPGACCRAPCSVSGPSGSCAVTADWSGVERGCFECLWCLPRPGPGLVVRRCSSYCTIFRLPLDWAV